MDLRQLLVSDEGLAVLVPIVVYWAYCGLHVALGQSIYMDKYRLHPAAHEDSKNYVSKREVITTVLKQQLVQVAMAAMVFKLMHMGGGPPRAATVSSSSSNNSKLLLPTTTTTVIIRATLQIAASMLWYDVWQYAWHRVLHANRFLYRRFHSWHHRLVVPYVFGALYGHPLEGFVVDTLGGVAAFLVSGMSPRASVVFFSLCTLKVIDNHNGVSLLPGLDRRGVWNSAAYHDVHHQLRGGHCNYSQLFFTVWDRIFGTYMPFLIEDTAGEGGAMLQVRAPGLDCYSRRTTKNK